MCFFVCIDGSLKNIPIATIVEEESVSGGEVGEGGGGEGGGEVGKFVFTYINNESDSSVWPDGVPWDGSPLAELRHPLLGLVLLCYVLSGVVIVWAVVSIIFNLCFREKK